MLLHFRHFRHPWRSDAQGGITSYWTDATGNTLALVDAKGRITTAVYNALGQRSSGTTGDRPRLIR